MFDKLTAPFDPAAVSWRAGAMNKDKTKTMALAYVDARDVMNRLDEVCGPFGWQSEHVVTGDMVTCHIRIKDPDTGEWITKSDGAGKTDVEGEKGSYSDSLKRAAVSWGIGRYLYDLATPWVEVEAWGRSYRIKDSEKPKLLRALAAKEVVRHDHPRGGRENNAQSPPLRATGAPVNATGILGPQSKTEPSRHITNGPSHVAAGPSVPPTKETAAQRIVREIREAKFAATINTILAGNHSKMQRWRETEEGNRVVDEIIRRAEDRKAELSA